MVKIVYTIYELLHLRHYEVVDLKQELANILLDTSNNKFGKGHQNIKKRLTKFKNNSGNCTYSNGYTPYFMKENRFAQEYSYDRRISGIKIPSQTLKDNESALSATINNNNYYDARIQYPLFNLSMFPPGSRIIRIEPGNPLPKGAIPIPFRFEDEFAKASDSIKQVNQTNYCINESQNHTTDKVKNKKYKNNSIKPNSNRPMDFQTPKNRKYTPALNPYSVTGFFPEREVVGDIIMSENASAFIHHQKPFSHNLPNTSQTSINDNDSSTTVGSSSCDSYNIQIQISATH
ncbi:DEHA2E16962p [Debaryomyces hansenii CBS767]|uniref:DEHA2E16962p n=1 Tax=Debaryomyces hansenii (strain ATCC 36239 / CBS 767 / BCRC 21394 / JCM 1990 / NBRC 0083 / IGC 2968) TaxID=284592 RepID=B5RU31_DEBHA|nr:DEHA2E16962p [Debaryomyces hansenii CBS767]CAR65843.1 DEHA2E16962p [Debaryomyces hansenii CBS767]|eukprot:XP_002770500.1 DEHA2E16962p [Debaryomyces hansenii CBS767]